MQRGTDTCIVRRISLLQGLQDHQGSFTRTESLEEGELSEFNY